jgi:hypothetical protein
MKWTQRLATKVQNIWHEFHLLNLGYNKIITIPIVMSDNRNFCKPNQNKCAVINSNTNE